jgi:uncharacterized protein YndB with AHSA1/START domain
MTAETSRFEYVAYVVSTPDKVFDAITRPEIARQYWAHENVSEWIPGARWEHIRADDQRKVGIVGNVLECQPRRRLVLSWASPAQYADAALHSRVTIDIEPYEGMVRLTVAHENLAKGSSMEKGISKGWPVVLSSLKSFLETGRAIDVFAKPLAA